MCSVNDPWAISCLGYYAFEIAEMGFAPSVPGFINNTAFSTVISHEYGHFIVDQLLPFGLAPLDFQEGAADNMIALLQGEMVEDCLNQ